MKALIICSTTSGEIAPFVKEQVTSIVKKNNITIEYLEIKNKGVFGYLKGYISLIKQLRKNKYDLIHAHYGLCGLIACMQPFKPVVITFHGCDVNDTKTRWISKLAYKLSNHSIFVEESMPGKLNAKRKLSIIPCGVNTEIFKPINNSEAKKQLNFTEKDPVILFSSAFDVPVKNYPLAKKSIEKFPNAQLVELKNYSREEVNLLLNAADLLLLTSIREGSPQIIKEALACNCPIVATNVGDIKERIKDVSQAFICNSTSDEISEKINVIIRDNKRTNGREKLIKDKLDLESISEKIFNVYNTILI